MAPKPKAYKNLTIRESFENIYLDLSKQPGKCRFAADGIGWKPNAGGDAWTLGQEEIVQGLWSRASRGHELKMYTRASGVVQLDGFKEDVRPPYSDVEKTSGTNE
jgi:structure-specific recognition protein 1